MGRLFEFAPLVAPFIGLALIWKYRVYLTKITIILSVIGALFMFVAFALGALGEVALFWRGAHQAEYVELATEGRALALFSAWVLLGIAAFTGRHFTKRKVQ